MPPGNGMMTSMLTRPCSSELATAEGPQAPTPPGTGPYLKRPQQCPEEIADAQSVPGDPEVREVGNPVHSLQRERYIGNAVREGPHPVGGMGDSRRSTILHDNQCAACQVPCRGVGNITYMQPPAEHMQPPPAALATASFWPPLFCKPPLTAA